jgi:FkbM family methyltransferase
VLKKAAVTSGYEEWGLQVRQYAVNNADTGYAFFPNASTEAGVEKKGIDSGCNSENVICEPVKTTRLDLLMEEEGLAEKRIDVLLIDVEGWDFEVLKGASDTLRRTSYVEFEFNWRGKWGKDWNNRPLFKAISILDNLEFTCYFPGKGDLRRITGCWAEQYRGVFFSNVVCVNRVLAPDFAIRMENLFNSTISNSTEALADYRRRFG